MRRLIVLITVVVSLAGTPGLHAQHATPTPAGSAVRTAEPSAVHWHGIELDSYYDGPAGWAGTPGRSFDVRITPERAGTFMYHTHFDELRQQYGGLIGVLVVLEPGPTLGSGARPRVPHLPTEYRAAR